MRIAYPFISKKSFSELGLAGGVNEDYTFLVRTSAVGKTNSPESPYLLANEWIAGNLAQFLRLPVPPFAIVRGGNPKTTMFISYNFDGDTKPDDVDPRALYENHPDLCAGITVFDVFVANCDRNARNLKVDNPAKPKVCHLIDHERALFYIDEGKGIERLASRENRLGVSDGHESLDDFHCLIGLLDSLPDISGWVRKIEQIPDWFIDGVCDDVPYRSLKKAEINAAKDFLKNRRSRLGQLIHRHRERFVSIRRETWVDRLLI